MNSNYQILIEIHRKGGGRPRAVLDHSTHGGFSELAIFDAAVAYGGPKSKSTVRALKNQAWTCFIHVYMYVIACERMQVCVCVIYLHVYIYI